MKEQIQQMIIEQLKALGDELDNKELKEANVKTRIFGEGGSLNSMSLVILLGEIEQALSDKFEKDVVLADERAMSQKTSPFRSVMLLTDYINTLLEES